MCKPAMKLQAEKIKKQREDNAADQIARYDASLQNSSSSSSTIEA